MTEGLLLKEAADFKKEGDRLLKKGLIEVTEEWITLKSAVKFLRWHGTGGIGKGTTIPFKYMTEIEEKEKGMGPLKHREITIKTSLYQEWHVFTKNKGLYPLLCDLKEKAQEEDKKK